MPFIEKLIEHTKIYESPTSFWYWSALLNISAVARDNVWIQEGRNQLWLNIYVMLYAGSAGRKDRPVKFSKELLSRIDNGKIISGRASIQAVLDELANSETDRTTGKMKKAGCATWLAGELAAGIVGDEAAIGILTDLYDCPTDYKSILRHGPKFKIDRVVFSALTASNDNMMKSFFTSTAIYGGLLSRTMLITEAGEFRSGKSLNFTEEQEKQIDKEFDSLTNDLKVIANFKGALRFSPEAEKAFDNWYSPYREGYRKGDPAGIAGRMHTHAKKIAALLALNDHSQVIQKKHIEKAIHDCVSLIPNYKLLVMSTGKSELADAGGLLLQKLLEAPGYGMTEKMILGTLWQDIDKDMLDKLIQNFSAADILGSMLEGGQIKYVLKQHFVERMRK